MNSLISIAILSFIVSIFLIIVKKRLFRASNKVNNSEFLLAKVAIEDKLKNSEKLLKTAGRLTSLSVWEIDVTDMKMMWSDEGSIMHDLPPGVTPTIEEGVAMILPEYRENVRKKIIDCMTYGNDFDVEFQSLTAKNRVIWVRSTGIAVRNSDGEVTSLEGAFQDITKYKNLELFNTKQANILKKIATNVPLIEVLEDSILLVQERYPALICSVNLLDDTGKKLKTGTSKNLPHNYVNAINGLEIGKSVGSCGTAAFERRVVIVSDIANDPLWKDYKQIALQYGLKSCWSWPLFSSKKKVIGTFAVYGMEVVLPSSSETELIETAVKTVEIAIEKDISDKQIYLLESAISRVNDIVMITQSEPTIDPDPLTIFVNDAFEKRTGYTKEEIIGKSPRILHGPNTQKSELKRIRDAISDWQPVCAELINYKKNGEEFWLELDIVPITDKTGCYTHWVSIERDITKRKLADLELARTTRAMRMLGACNEHLIRANDELELISDICKVAVEVGGYRMAWVGYRNDDDYKSITPKSSFGTDSVFLNSLNLSWSSENVMGQGPEGNTIRSGKTLIIKNSQKDSSYPAIDSAIKLGCLGLISLPLRDKNGCFGLLALYLSEVRNIAVDEIKLLEEMADDLAYGITNLRSEAEQARIQSAIVNVATSVSLPANNQFFEKLAMSMAEAVGADAGFIAKLFPETSLNARTLAAVVDGKVIGNIEYDVLNSPCVHLLRSDYFIMSKSPEECYNPSETMISIGMKDYIGLRLINSQGEIAGMIFVMMRKIIPYNDFIISTLKIFAARASAEIERQDIDQHIREQASLLDKANDAIIVRGIDHKVKFWNKGSENLYGWTKEESLGKSILDLIYVNNTDFANAESELLKYGNWKGEVTQNHKSGKQIVAEVHWTLVKDELGYNSSVLCINTDITSRKLAAEKIQKLAFYDQLTNLPNRLLFQERLLHAQSRNIRSGYYGSLLYIDIDNFKVINDTLGHDSGDKLLESIAYRLLSSTRSSDTLARIGGDEFVILVEQLGTNPNEAAIQCQILAEKIIEIFILPFDIGNLKYFSSPSIGITIFQGVDLSVNELLKRADLAMYQAKSSGKNTYRFFDPEMQIIVNKRVELENDLRDALNKDEFVLNFQPQFHDNGNCVGVEALIRWNHESKGLIPNDQFIPLAEETRLILPIGDWVLERACETLVRWEKIKQFSNLTVAVNVSLVQFRQDNFVGQVLKLIKKSGANPNKLKLELTENLFVDNVQDIIKKMSELKALGIKLSLDDFGTGYSSLSYLKLLPFDQLKIDKSFIQEVQINIEDAAIAKGIITLAKSLGIEVIAEGVETFDQKEFLNKEGCLLYQGYFFSKPLRLEILEKFLLQNKFS